MTNDAADLGAPPDRVRRAALFLDLDGVLAELAPTPESVGPDPRRAAVLARLAERLEGRLAVVSGREISDVDRILEGGVALVAGVHGLERRGPDGQVSRRDPAPGVALAAAAFDRFAEGRPGVLVERKGVATGLHVRRAPHLADEARALAADLAREHGLAHQPGHMIEELKTPGADKGSALSAFMAEAPFAGATPVMVGDDLTDEHGFAAAAAGGGFGILVGPPRRTAAGYRLAGPAEVLAWLDRFDSL
jgi:trehalose 6-phosphate phosphatase